MSPSYTGAVTPGGPSNVRELPDVVIRKASVSSMDNNVYLITDRATGEQLLVDAADDVPRVLALVAEGVPDAGHGLALVVTTVASPVPPSGIPSATRASTRGASSAASTSSCSPVARSVSR